PLFHAHGLISGMLAALTAGSTVVCVPEFDPAAFFGRLKEFRATWFTAVPTMLRLLVLVARDAHRLGINTSLRFIRSGSGLLSPRLVQELEALFGVPVIQTYGMTETAQITANPVRRRKLGSVGQPVGTEVAILGREGEHLATGQHGEIAIRGPTV